MNKLKRYIAIVCIILLIGMYALTLIMAITDNSNSMNMFRGCVAMTIFVPAVIYGYICLHKYAMTRSGRKNYYAKDKESSNTNSSDTSLDT